MAEVTEAVTSRVMEVTKAAAVATGEDKNSREVSYGELVHFLLHFQYQFQSNGLGYGKLFLWVSIPDYKPFIIQSIVNYTEALKVSLFKITGILCRHHVFLSAPVVPSACAWEEAS